MTEGGRRTGEFRLTGIHVRYKRFSSVVISCVDANIGEGCLQLALTGGVGRCHLVGWPDYRLLDTTI